MKTKLFQIKLATRIALIALVTAVPLLGVTLFFIFTTASKDIRFGQWELYGNEYQRPLETLLQWLPQHQSLVTRARAGDGSVGSALAESEGKIDQAFALLGVLDRKLGVALQFTEDGLRKRKREHVRLATVRKEWQELKGKRDSSAAGMGDAEHAHLVGDVRTMITHAGDTSNLILDPDLDSYYTMDITLLALPQMQERLATVTAFGLELLQHPSVTPKEHTQLSVHASLLKDVDLDRITADAQTALNEDANFYDVSESLQRNLPPALKEYADASGAFIELVQRLADPEKPRVVAADFAIAGTRARDASFKFWTVAANELDELLETRIASYSRARGRVLIFTAVSLVSCAVVTTLMVRRLNHALNGVLRRVGGSCQSVSAVAGQSATTSQSLAEGASEQAAALEETGASLEEMWSTTQRNAENAQKAKELANQTRAAADTGAGNMQEMNRAMDGIKTSSDNIAKIIKTIDEIAFQTNILALNAAVEAARAGEAGMGFAVVADEVRNLAQRSAMAARETAERIEDSIRKSEHGVEISAKVALGLQEILAKARQVDELVAEIASASSEQSQGIQQINVAVSQVDKVTQTNAAAAQESARVAEFLRDEAASLQEAVEQLLVLVGGKHGFVIAPTAPAARPGHDHGLPANAWNRPAPGSPTTPPAPKSKPAAAFSTVRPSPASTSHLLHSTTRLESHPPPGGAGLEASIPLPEDTKSFKDF